MRFDIGPALILCALLHAGTCGRAISQGTPPPCSASAIVLDGTTPGLVTPGVSNRLILGGQLSTDHRNLFHSFSCLSIGSEQTATFLNTEPGIENIVARVTGDHSSTIAGQITTRIGPSGSDRVSLFLLNPNGVVFEGDRSLNLNGLVVSTASELIFDSGAIVSLDSDRAELGRATGYPVHFGDLGSDKGKDGSDATIQFNNSELTMTNGGDVALVARNIQLSGRSRIETANGQVLLVGAGPGNSVSLDLRDRSLTPAIAEPASGTVSFNGFSGVSTSHLEGGRIVVRGGVLTFADNGESLPALHVDGDAANPGVGIDVEATRSLTLDRSRISTGSSTTGVASDISIKAPEILLTNQAASINRSFIRTEGEGGDIHVVATGRIDIEDGGIVTNVGGDASGGNIRIEAPALTITGRSAIQSLAGDSSSGGNIDTIIDNDLRIDGQGGTTLDSMGVVIPETVGIVANTDGSGRGGEINVEVGGNLEIRNGGLLDSTTFSTGDAGKITARAENLTIDGDSFAFATGITGLTVDTDLPDAGAGGSIEVNVPGTIAILNGGQIDTSSFGTGEAGGITVGMTEVPASIAIDRGTATRFNGIGSDTSGSGNAGEITVRARMLTIRNGGLISTGVFAPGDGPGGSINVFSQSILATGRSSGGDDGTSIVPRSAIFAGTQSGSTGDGGNVIIKPLTTSPTGPEPTLTLRDGAEIAANSDGSGNAGSVEILLPGGSVELDSGSSLATRSGEEGGEAGNVVVQASQLSVLNDSSLSSTNLEEAVLDANGDILTPGGRAGGIDMQVGELLVANGSLEVSSVGGDAGQLRITGDGLLDFQNARVEAEAFRDGGDITVGSSRAILLDKSAVSANALRGDGGNILLQAPVVLSNASTVTARTESQLGVDGVVEIEAQAVLSGAEGQLEASPLDATARLQPECTQRLVTKQGSFIRTGRGGAERLPGGYLPSVRLQQVR